MVDVRRGRAWVRVSFHGCLPTSAAWSKLCQRSEALERRDFTPADTPYSEGSVTDFEFADIDAAMVPSLGAELVDLLEHHTKTLGQWLEETA
jgi:hypothetical protein